MTHSHEFRNCFHNRKIEMFLFLKVKIGHEVRIFFWNILILLDAFLMDIL